MNGIKVSIIVNTYNGASYVAQIIKCLQPFNEKDGIEFILVDDGSLESDYTRAVFKNAFSNATIIYGKNVGLAEARNKGAAVAKGEFLQFIDIDDSIDPDKIDKQYEFAQRTGADVVYSDWRMVIVDLHGNIKPEDWVKSKKQDNILVSLLDGWWNPFHSYLIRKDVYMKVNGSNSNLVNAQDFDLMLRLAIEDCKFEYLEGDFSSYFRYNTVTSLARGNRSRYWKDTEETVFNGLKLIHQKRGYLSEDIKNAACNRLFYIARNVYNIDLEWNRKLMQKLNTILPNFKPRNQSRYFNLALKIFDYETAEKIIAVVKKKIGRSLK